MSKSILDDSEIKQILFSIVKNESIHKVDEILCDCHEFKTFGNLMPYEKYFNKKLFYRNYDMQLYRYLVENENIVLADIQFKRKARYQIPFFSRNYFLLKRLKNILDSLYESEKIISVGDLNGKQIHYKASNCFTTSVPFEQWKSECALYDEPYSSGRTLSDVTSIRNDFVLIRFRRKKPI